MTLFCENAVRAPDRRNTFSLPDARLMAWSEWGPADGRPVLFSTGAGMSGTLGFGLEHVDDLGIRLIAPDRPGLGRSTPNPNKTLNSIADDFKHLVRHLRLERVSLVAFSQGAPFALAFAARGGTDRVGIVSGQDDLSHPGFRDGLPNQVRHMLDQAKTDPEGFVAMLEGFADADGFYDLVLSMSSDEDRALYGAEPFASAYRLALAEGFRQGPSGYARDTLAALRTWPIDLSAIGCPVTLWYGGRDTSPVHSPDFGQTLETRLPHASRRFFAEEGGALLWTRSRDILSELAGR